VQNLAVSPLGPMRGAAGPASFARRAT
jgi:hypothetical protein